MKRRPPVRGRVLAGAMPPMRAAFALVPLALLLAFAGCGSSSSGSSTPAATSTPSTAASSSATTSASAPAVGSSGQTLTLAANPEGQLKYNATSLTAKAGKVTIDFTNMAPLSHNVTVASSAGSVLGATPTFQGGSKTLTLNLKAGVYKFYCTVPGHRAAGMEGTLTVQ
jgi:plastocyanin